MKKTNSHFGRVISFLLLFSVVFSAFTLVSINASVVSDYAVVKEQSLFLDSEEEPIPETVPIDVKEPIDDNIVKIEFEIKGGEGCVSVKWSEVPGAVRYEFILVTPPDDSSEGFSKTIATTTKPFVEWWHPASMYTKFGITAFNADNVIIGKSSLDSYGISQACVDWWGMCGDADFDYRLSVKDATFIQKYVAGLVEFGAPQDQMLEVADTNDDYTVDIKDATAIQKYLAGIVSSGHVGEERWWGSCDYYFVNKI